MTKLRTAFHGAREVLARRATVAQFAVLADAGAAAVPAILAPLAVLAEAGAAAVPALIARLAVLAEAGAAAVPASMAPLVVRTILTIAIYWMWRRGGEAVLPELCVLPAARGP